MDNWFLIQITLNLVFAVGLAIVWIRLKRPPQDDPRLSRGLQLLQSKIAILEDLSDRTDTQVEQLSNLLEQKTRHLQAKVFEAEKQIQKVDHSMHRSMEVAEIFQDKIPHSEIIERQNTVKYVLAAQLAHQGLSVDEIVERVNLPQEQVEFIAKVNKDELMFDVEQLPPWARKQLEKQEVESVEEMIFSEEFEEPGDIESEEKWSVGPDLGRAFEVPSTEMSNLKKLGEEFRQACASYEEKQKVYEKTEVEPSRVLQAAQKVTQKLMNASSDLLHNFQNQESEPETKPAAPPEVAPVDPRRFLPIQETDSLLAKTTPPVATKPSVSGNTGTSPTAHSSGKTTSTVKVMSSSLNEKSAKMRIKEVSSQDVKKVLFPKIDIDNHLA